MDGLPSIAKRDRFAHRLAGKFGGHAVRADGQAHIEKRPRRDGFEDDAIARIVAAIADKRQLLRLLQQGTEQARALTDEVLAEVKGAMGLDYFSGLA